MRMELRCHGEKKGYCKDVNTGPCESRQSSEPEFSGCLREGVLEGTQARDHCPGSAGGVRRRASKNNSYIETPPKYHASIPANTTKILPKYYRLNRAALTNTAKILPPNPGALTNT